MIVFDLRCSSDHVFEAWFGSSAAYEDQRARSLLCCPICSTGEVEKAVMAPRVGAKGNSVAVSPNPDPRAVLSAIATAQAAALKESKWVGSDFASEARAIHDGDKPERLIHGQATRAEARALIDDGVPVAPLLVPVVPPKSLN